MENNLNISQVSKNTAGVHCIGIYENNELIIACEDVARHNALDKAIGYCILNRSMTIIISLLIFINTI